MRKLQVKGGEFQEDRAKTTERTMDGLRLDLVADTRTVTNRNGL
jgi:hypothetical protein